MSYKDLVYCACPARLGDSKPEIMEYAASKDKGPLHPFNALPYAYFEGGRPGRVKTMEVFGISEGTLIEAKYFFEKGYDKTKKVKVLVDLFDQEWKMYAAKFTEEFESTLQKLGLK